MTTKIDFVNSDLDDLSCHIGDTFEFDIVVKQECSGLPDDLTGYTVTLAIFDYETNTTIDTIVGTSTDLTTGEINFIIPTTKTTAYSVGMYNHTISLAIGSRIDRIAEGYFEVSL